MSDSVDYNNIVNKMTDKIGELAHETHALLAT